MFNGRQRRISPVQFGLCGDNLVTTITCDRGKRVCDLWIKLRRVIDQHLLVVIVLIKTTLQTPHPSVVNVDFKVRVFAPPFLDSAQRRHVVAPAYLRQRFALLQPGQDRFIQRIGS